MKQHIHGLVVLSGGQDSTTCLYLAKEECEEVSALTFNYGQRHDIEIISARTIAQMAGVMRHEVLSIGDGILESTSPLVDNTAEVERYASADVLPGGIEKTFIPMRNALFLTIAANRAAAWECDAIYTGVCGEDYGGYPDCRMAFVEAQAYTIRRALEGAVGKLPVVKAPLMYLTKTDAVRLAQRLPDCMMALRYSHTCYNGAAPPCGHCHACLLRSRGFADAGVRDPLLERFGAGA